MEHAKEERENLGAHDVNVGDAKEYFQEAAAELELKTVLLERRLARAKDVEEDGNHVGQDTSLCISGYSVYHLAQLTRDRIFRLEVYGKFYGCRAR